MTYLLDWHIIATAVIRVLPTRRNILKGLPSDMDALISEVTSYIAI